ncbi:hypothetical protein Nepgr_024367 [Nepenthes gracilis]|uniref:Homeobox-leucine zipper protein n=1 Tax=Nepenthes gracilis TaxID=150966 RepID=A0AAD3T4I1_NEPGR|nr:hypothetical protein Nepgr_024367 [Nepenthes gracilis]
MCDGGEYFPSAATAEGFTRKNPVSSSKKKKTMKNKNRFSDEQIRLLESIFQNDSKIEPPTKVQLARELGLQPRQVAIWFQNKRARQKSKQLELDYQILRANYHALESRFENLKKENQSLVKQLQKLTNVVGKPAEAENNINRYQFVDDGSMREFELNAGLSLEGSEFEAAILSSDDGCSESKNYLEMEDETNLFRMAEPATCCSMISGEDWHGTHSDNLFGQSNDHQWWDFWP